MIITIALAAVFILLVAEALYRHHILVSVASRDPSLQYILFYSTEIQRKENHDISFRLYSRNADLKLAADFHLNNMGYFSHTDYVVEKKENEFRIVVIGGEQAASTVVNESWPAYLEKILNSKKELFGKDKIITVFNIAWPDAGPEHYLDYWTQTGKQLNPDMVIVNIVETDFWRVGSDVKGPELKIGGNPLIEGYRLSYQFDDEVAYTPMARTKDVTSLRSGGTTVNRPFSFFASRRFMDNRKSVHALHETIINDFLTIAERSRYYPWSLMRLFGRRIDPISLRNFDPFSTEAPDLNRLVEKTEYYLRQIKQDYPSTLFIHSANWVEIVQNTQFKMTEQLMKKNPALNIIDMRSYLPQGVDEAEIKSWYLYPIMGEKWSVKGHHIYAHAVAKLMMDVMMARTRNRKDVETAVVH